MEDILLDKPRHETVVDVFGIAKWRKVKFPVFVHLFVHGPIAKAREDFFRVHKPMESSKTVYMSKVTCDKFVEIAVEKKS